MAEQHSRREGSAIKDRLVEHKALPEGHWWACEHPERPSEDGRTHFRPRCARCYPAWRATAAIPGKTFYVGGEPRSLHSGHSEAEIRAWFIEGIVPPSSGRTEADDAR